MKTNLDNVHRRRNIHGVLYKYIDKNVGHVITGNLTIVRHRKLRKLLQKGPSYREPNNIN